MRIARHRLNHDDGSAYEWRPSPNRGGKLEPEYLVMHYTSGRSLEESVAWLADPAARASAHVVIGRDGRVVQQVAFDRVAWHAGASRWEGRTGLNHWSVGIELDNAGKLTFQHDRWRAWFGDAYDEDEVLVATHKHETEMAGWHLYSPVQIATAMELASLLVERYQLRDVIGHEDISPDRKVDPGPAFPMASFRARVLGRRETASPVYRTTAVLNIRRGAGTEHATLPGSPLPLATHVEIVATRGSWRLVDVAGEVNGIMDLQGWVHGRYLERAPSDREAAVDAVSRDAGVPAGGG